MANLKALRGRIQSVQSTHKITAAMKLVATSKLRRLQEGVMHFRPFARELQAMIRVMDEALPSGLEPDLMSLVRGRGRFQRYLLVVFSSQRGLCGHFNVEIAKHTQNHIYQLLEGGKEVFLLVLGRKGKQLLSADFGDRMGEIEFSPTAIEHPDWVQSQTLSEVITAFCLGRDIDVCQFIYSRFVSALTQKVLVETVLPLNEAALGYAVDADARPASMYTFEPHIVPLFNAILPLYMGTLTHYALLENAASAEAARMFAMDNATRNAEEMLDSLKTRYNRTRQTNITREMMEIVSGAEALQAH